MEKPKYEIKLIINQNVGSMQLFKDGKIINENDCGNMEINNDNEAFDLLEELTETITGHI